MKMLLILLSTLSFNLQAAIERPEVQVTTGKIQGAVEGNMLTFKGIPYATPPVGELRWRPPQAAKTWIGTRDASKFGSACPQPYIKGLNDGMVPSSEDCLSLNVFTPKAGKNLPVMVWIHGGGLLVDAARDAQFTPINLIKNGVIVVTFDYRMGTFGFFAPKELIDEAKVQGEPVGNYGIMDQIAVLKWVKNNIQAFGGDPNNVTIFGESAGGRSVTWLMVSPAARGLFHKGIAQSAQQTPIRGMTEARFGLLPEQDLDAKIYQQSGGEIIKRVKGLADGKTHVDFSSV